MIVPNRPEHANKITPISGTSPRFTIERQLTGYAYAANGNVHNPSPRYRWLLRLDGCLVDTAERRDVLVSAAREPRSVENYSR
jgi:hypothetical protein